jgi:hypothetical protein
MEISAASNNPERVEYFSADKPFFIQSLCGCLFCCFISPDTIGGYSYSSLSGFYAFY